MNLSLYCAPNQLRLLVGTVSGQKATVDEFREFSLPERSMINGIITDKDAMTRFLKTISQRFGPYNQDATLVIESTNIRTKIMTLPTVKESKLLDFVQQDFGEISEGTDDVFDFTVLGPNQVDGGLNVLGIAAGKVLLQNYIDILNLAGFKLKRIDISLNALAKVARFIPQLQVGNNVLVLVDEDALNVTLFTQGSYRISQRYRMINATKTDERIAEAADNLSSMVQFQKSQHRDISIDAIYVLGSPPDRFPVFVEATRYLDIPVYELNYDDRIKLTGKAHFDQNYFIGSRFLYNIGGLMRK